MPTFRRSSHSPRIDKYDDDCSWLGAVRRPWPIQGAAVLPVDEDRRRRLRREENEDLRRYRTSLQYDPWASRAVSVERQQREQQIDPDEEEFVETMRGEEHDRAAYAKKVSTGLSNPELHTALLDLHPDALASLLDDPDRFTRFIQDHPG